MAEIVLRGSCRRLVAAHIQAWRADDGRNALVFRARQADYSQRFVRFKRATFECHVAKCALESVAWSGCGVNQVRKRIFSKHLLIRFNRDLAVNPGGDIRIVIGPGLSRLQ